MNTLIKKLIIRLTMKIINCSWTLKWDEFLPSVYCWTTEGWNFLLNFGIFIIWMWKNILYIWSTARQDMNPTVCSSLLIHMWCLTKAEPSALEELNLGFNKTVTPLVFLLYPCKRSQYFFHCRSELTQCERFIITHCVRPALNLSQFVSIRLFQFVSEICESDLCFRWGRRSFWVWLWCRRWWDTGTTVSWGRQHRESRASSHRE